jgi:hypothetical protein
MSYKKQRNLLNTTSGTFDYISAYQIDFSSLSGNTIDLGQISTNYIAM